MSSPESVGTFSLFRLSDHPQFVFVNVLLYGESISSLLMSMSRQGCIRAGRHHCIHSPMKHPERAVLIAELTERLAELAAAE